MLCWWGEGGGCKLSRVISRKLRIVPDPGDELRGTKLHKWMVESGKTSSEGAKSQVGIGEC